MTVEPRLTPALTDPGPSCGDNVTLSVTPTGNYLYRWYINNVLQANLGGSEILATPANNGNAFSVGIYSPVTGCTATSNEVVIVIDPALTVDLASTTPCEGSPFTLTATPSRTATFQWSLNGSVISGQANATLLDQRAGLYEVIASAAACTATSSIDISLAPITPGSLTEQVFICPDPANPDPNTRTVTLRPGQFSSYDWQDFLREHRLKPSMSRRGNCHDNAVAETFFATFKKEEAYRREYSSEADFRKSVDAYIQFYNEHRPHRTLKYKTPQAFEDAYKTSL